MCTINLLDSLLNTMTTLGRSFLHPRSRDAIKFNSYLRNTGYLDTWYLGLMDTKKNQSTSAKLYMAESWRMRKRNGL